MARPDCRRRQETPPWKISSQRDKGHMQRQRQDIRSTKERFKEALDDSEEKKINPPATVEKQNHLFS